jgi:hypothetical protein
LHSSQIVSGHYRTCPVFEHRLLIINVNRTATETSLYSAVSFAWKIDPRKARRADYVLAVRQGLIVGAFVADEWLQAVSTNFPGRDNEPNRYGFRGGPAPVEIERLYVNKRLPDEYRKPGAANPVRYTYK